MNTFRHSRLAAALSMLLNPAVGVPLTSIPSLMEVDGALVPAAALQAALSNIIAQGVSLDTPAFNTSAATALTISNINGLVQRLTAASAITVTLDSAYNIVNNIQNPFLGETVGFIIVAAAAGTVATPTLTDSTITLSGTTSIAATAMRAYQAQITQLNTTSAVSVTPGTTFSSMAQQGTTNGYNLTLATNAVVPVVGQCIYINVTAGTLPSGFYPIVNVTSATSFRIAAPLASTAWTATAATFPTVAVPSGGVYSPLMTITGMYTATGYAA